MNRRTLLKTGGLAALGSITLATAACGKNLSTYVSIIIGALEELSPLVPSASPLISKAIKVAKDFDDAYRAGKFANAISLFENLAGVVGEIADSIGVGSQPVKAAIAVAGIAMRAIAVLLKQQAADPAVASAISAAASSKAGARQKSLVEKLADPNAINQLFEAAKP